MEKNQVNIILTMQTTFFIFFKAENKLGEMTV